MGSDKRNTGWKLESMVRGENLALCYYLLLLSGLFQQKTWQQQLLFYFLRIPRTSLIELPQSSNRGTNINQVAPLFRDMSLTFTSYKLHRYQLGSSSSSEIWVPEPQGPFSKFVESGKPNLLFLQITWELLPVGIIYVSIQHFLFIFSVLKTHVKSIPFNTFSVWMHSMFLFTK